jgi:hypothetical protein
MQQVYTQSGLSTVKPLWKDTLVLRLVLIAALVALAACNGSPTEPPPDPLELLAQAASNIRGMETFRMSVDLSGADYFIETDFGSVAFRRAVAQYIAPNVMQATVRVLLGSVPLDVDVFSRGENQWFRAGVWTGGDWVNATFAPGFNPEALIAQESGFQAALNSLIDLERVGVAELEDGTPVHHLRALAAGEDVSALMVGLIYAAGNVNVDVYIHQDEVYPVRFVIVQPDTATEATPEPTTWTVDVYDLNAEPDIDDPEAAS